MEAGTGSQHHVTFGASNSRFLQAGSFWKGLFLSFLAKFAEKDPDRWSTKSSPRSS